MRTLALTSVLTLFVAVAPGPATAVLAAEPTPATDEAAQPATPAEVEAAANELRAALEREVPGLLAHEPADDAAWTAATEGELKSAGITISRPQLLVSVDRNPAVQEMRLLLARPDGPWMVLGAIHISTGEWGHTGHYKTPTGVFPHTRHILEYRAEGTFNRHHQRGLGVRGMRVWDFGWRSTEDWREPNAQTKIRLQIHATDPDTLAHQIGHLASKGCVHVSAALNRFLDRHGILDFDYEQAAETDPRYRELLGPDFDPTPIAGTLLVVFDSGEPPTSRSASSSS